MCTYRRNFEQLERVASKFWTSEISGMEADLSIIPLLLETQEEFISILSIPVEDLDNLLVIVENAALSNRLFLKHLVILADFGGEMLKRVSNEFKILFPLSRFSYTLGGQQRNYDFKALPNTKLSNHNLRIDGKALFNESEKFDNLQKDAIALLLFGGEYNDTQGVSSTLARCQIGNYLGKRNELYTFIQQRYIWVSRITGGAKSNSLGQLAQKFVKDYIQDNLKLENITLNTGGRLPEVTHTDSTTGRLTSFDIVVSDSRKYVAIEVSFQVTTNSVIERKAGQAKSRYEQIIKAGHRIAYVIDGAGNFERESALKTICTYSSCTVAFSSEELDVLCNFLREYFNSSI